MRKISFQKLKNILPRSNCKEILLFLFFLILSGVFWFTYTMSVEYEMEILVPVRLTGIPNNVVITTDIQDSLRVTLRDKGTTLLKYKFSNDSRSITLDFNSHIGKDFNGVISTQSLAKVLHNMFKTAQISSIKPDKLEFFYNYGKNKKIPVRLDGNITTAPTIYISKVQISPDSVIVYSTEKVLDSIQFVTTRPTNISNLSDTTEVQVALNPLKATKYVPNTVTVKLFPDFYTEEDLDIPIKCINVPEGKVMRTFPAKAKVHFVVGMKKFKEMTPDNFTVETDYREIATNPDVHKCHLTLRSMPQHISRAKLVTTDVEFLIEDK